MKRSVLFSLLVSAAVCVAATQGSFRGKIVGGPEASGGLKWLYVQGPKGNVRRVEISGARVSYAAEVSRRDRAGNPEDSLREGVQVQVDASQDGNGEWKASRVTILRVSGGTATSQT